MTTTTPETLAAKLPPLPEHAYDHDDTYTMETVQLYSADQMREYALESLRTTSQPGGVPEGWKLVPETITEEMHAAAVKTLARCTGNDDFPRRVFKALLTASPTPPAVVAGDARDTRMATLLARTKPGHGLPLSGYAPQPDAKRAQLSAPPAAGDEPLTDDQIEERFKRAGGRWQEAGHWVIEDADLHPFVRSLAAPQPAQPSENYFNAWHAVVNELETHCPGFMNEAGTGIECAVAAIRRLAKASGDQPVAVGELPDDVRVPLDSMWADIEYLISRAIENQAFKGVAVESVKARIDQAKAAVLTKLASDEETVRQLNHALRDATEGDTFMGEPARASASAAGGEVVDKDKADGNPTNRYLFKLMCDYTGVELGKDNVSQAIDKIFKATRATPSPSTQGGQVPMTDEGALDDWILTLQAAHDESLNDEHTSARAMLRGVIEEMEAHHGIKAAQSSEGGAA